MKVIKCCVGEHTNSDCFKQSYIKSNHKKLIELTELPLEAQRIIKLRVGSELINTICLHHQCVFFIYFESTVLKTKFCCDPFHKHKKNVVGDKLISLNLSDSVFAATTTLRLIPGYKICKRCFEFLDSKIFKPSNQESPTKISLDSSEPLYFNSPEVKVYTPRRVISALSNASIISPIAELDRSNSERRLRICSDVLDKVKRNVLETEDLSLFYANDYKELLYAVRVKVFNLSSLKIYIY
jgi:hypothetical protein